MHKYKTKLKIRGHYLYLPVWLILVVVAVCVISGILIGVAAGKANEAVQASKNVAVTISDSEKEQTTKPKIDKSQWNLILVNKENYLPDDYNPKIRQLQDGHGIDERAYSDLQDMFDDCRAEGLNPLICSSYRTMEKQKRLFNNKIKEYIGYGYSDEIAKQKAGELVAIPGTSEHQLGLALDIVDVSYQVLDEKQEDTKTQKWLMNNSWKYGFILRYPPDKSDITGISYEPWHYRYVGKKAAKEIYDAKICLEEYLKD